MTEATKLTYKKFLENKLYDSISTANYVPHAHALKTAALDQACQLITALAHLESLGYDDDGPSTTILKEIT